MPEHEPVYLFRGTTRGWPGNDALWREGITCTTADPLVATLFAIECRNNGPAIILAARWDSFSEEERPDFTNHFWLMENEVVLWLPPVEFEKRAEVALEVDRALEILADLGFEGLPIRTFRIRANSSWYSTSRMLSASG